jgi:TP901 family phage tail tape measure protein
MGDLATLAINLSINANTAGAAELIAALGGVKSAAEVTQNALNGAGESGGLTKMVQELKKSAPTLTYAGAMLEDKVTAPIVEFGKASLAAANEYETALTGVTKTTGGTSEQVRKLSGEIKRMSRETGYSAVEIAGVAQAAGQLGVGMEDVAEFSRVMVEMGSATELGAADAAIALARFANIMGMPISESRNLGSAIVALGNNFATSEPKIVDMGLRLAAAGSQVDMTEASVMGLAAGLSSVGLEAEAGGTAFSRVILDMSMAAGKGEDGLKDFAQAAGMSTEAFTRLWERDATQGILTFVEGLSRVNEQGGNLASALEELGFSDVRVRDTLMRSAGAYEDLARAIQMANDAYAENTALTAEFDASQRTVETSLNRTRESITNMQADFGELFAPLAAKGADFAAGVADWFGSIPDAAQMVIGGLAGVAGAVGPVVSALAQVGTVAAHWGSLTSVFGSLASALSPIAAAVGPVALSVGAVGAAIAGIWTATTSGAREAEAAMKAAHESSNLNAVNVEAAAQRINDAYAGMEKNVETVVKIRMEGEENLNKLKEFYSDGQITQSEGKEIKLSIKADIDETFENIPDKLNEIQEIANIINEINAADTDLGQLVDATAGKTGEQAEANIAKIEDLIGRITDLRVKLVEMTNADVQGGVNALARLNAGVGGEGDLEKATAYMKYKYELNLELDTEAYAAERKKIQDEIDALTMEDPAGNGEQIEYLQGILIKLDVQFENDVEGGKKDLVKELAGLYTDSLGDGSLDKAIEDAIKSYNLKIDAVSILKNLLSVNSETSNAGTVKDLLTDEMTKVLSEALDISPDEIMSELDNAWLKHGGMGSLIGKWIAKLASDTEGFDKFDSLVEGSAFGEKLQAIMSDNFIGPLIEGMTFEEVDAADNPLLKYMWANLKLDGSAGEIPSDALEGYKRTYADALTRLYASMDEGAVEDAILQGIGSAKRDVNIPDIVARGLFGKDTAELPADVQEQLKSRITSVQARLSAEIERVMAENPLMEYGEAKALAIEVLVSQINLNTEGAEVNGGETPEIPPQEGGTVVYTPGEIIFDAEGAPTRMADGWGNAIEVGAVTMTPSEVLFDLEGNLVGAAGMDGQVYKAEGGVLEVTPGQVLVNQTGEAFTQGGDGQWYQIGVGGVTLTPEQIRLVMGDNTPSGFEGDLPPVQTGPITVTPSRVDVDLSGSNFSVDGETFVSELSIGAITAKPGEVIIDASGALWEVVNLERDAEQGIETVTLKPTSATIDMSDTPISYTGLADGAGQGKGGAVTPAGALPVVLAKVERVNADISGATITIVNAGGLSGRAAAKDGGGGPDAGTIPSVSAAAETVIVDISGAAPEFIGAPGEGAGAALDIPVTMTATVDSAAALTSVSEAASALGEAASGVEIDGAAAIAGATAMASGVAAAMESGAASVASAASAMSAAAAGVQIDPGPAVAQAQALGSGVAAGMQGAVGAVAAAASALSAAAQVSVDSGGAFSQGAALGAGLAAGIESGVSAVQAASAKLAAAVDAANRISAKLDINSPSRVMERIGRFVGEGLALGLDRGALEAENSAREMAARIYDTLSSVKLEPDVSGIMAALDGLGGASRVRLEADEGEQGMASRGGLIQNVTINAPNPLSPSRAARELRKVGQELAMAYS